MSPTPPETPQFPGDSEGMMALLASMSDDELQEMFDASKELEQRLAQYGPQTDDELHDWIKAEFGLDIPRVSVCEGHDAPFDFIADLYFERTDAALLMANRGGSKTFLVALLHWLNSKFKPGCESCTFGATEAQSFRAYAHLKGWVYDSNGDRRPGIIGSMMRETVFQNGSKVEVLSGTPEAVNGPHPQKAHADEIELMREDTWAESRNMTVSKRMPDGRLIKPQDIATSTRKGPNGRMQQLIDEITEAVQAGYKPPRKLYQWCIKETAAPVRNCQIARPDINEKLQCPCHTVRKGEWEDGSPRLLRDICNGDFYRSGGWQPYADVVKQFTENDPETFDVQQLCSKPEMRHHYVPSWRDERHCIRSFVPYPENGPIFQSVDWGGTNPHAVNWYQLLKYEVEALTWIQPDAEKPTTVRLKEGTIVCFDEIYEAEIGNDKLAELVKQREQLWASRLPGFRIYERFADPQGKAARMDWKNKGMVTRWHATREFDEHIKVVNDYFTDDLIRVCGDRCKNFVSEVKEWRADPKTGKQIDFHNHCMSDFRYALINIRKVSKRALNAAAVPQSRSIPRQSVTVSRPSEGPIGFRNKDSGGAMDQWRKSLGGPVTRVNP